MVGVVVGVSVGVPVGVWVGVSVGVPVLEGVGVTVGEFVGKLKTCSLDAGYELDLSAFNMTIMTSITIRAKAKILLFIHQAL